MRSLTLRGSLSRRFAPTISASLKAVWVNAPFPLQSPSAQIPGRLVCNWSSTTMYRVYLVGSRATAGIETDPRISQLDVTEIVWLDQLPAKDLDVEVLRFVLVAHSEEVS